MRTCSLTRETLDSVVLRLVKPNWLELNGPKASVFHFLFCKPRDELQMHSDARRMLHPQRLATPSRCRPSEAARMSARMQTAGQGTCTQWLFGEYLLGVTVGIW